ncbi:MAG: hypothetical protein N5P05_004099 (plasmid) [Chroococcopsis gigantea SAG 12.99]|nr:hypothetical protein [Chroococcopsis gigantea SAG 12.99]
MIKVVNGKKAGFVGKDKIYIGRSNSFYNLKASVLMNKFVIGKDGNREEVIEKYKKWLWMEFKKGGEVYEELVRIGKKVKEGESVELVCYCVPMGCHGNVVKRCIEWMIKDGLV